jgi:hypothetical protein
LTQYECGILADRGATAFSHPLSAGQPTPDHKMRMPVKLSAVKRVSEVAAALETAILANHFGVIPPCWRCSTPQLKGVPQEVEDTIVQIMQHAGGGGRLIEPSNEDS